MAVFAVLLYVLLSFFDTAQKATSISVNRLFMYENAKVAFDLIERDIQTIYYENEKTPFWHKGDTDAATWGSARNQMLYFVSTVSTPPNDLCESKYCEVKYQLYFASSITDANNGYLVRSLTGDTASDGSPNSKWNYLEDPVTGKLTGNFTVGYSGASKAFTGNEDSSDEFRRIIPYVTDVLFTCYRIDGTAIDPDLTGTAVTEFPYSIRVDITMMDRNSFRKWRQLVADASLNADNFRIMHQRTFSKTFLIGERGQYD